jgi:hypothetical protein
VAVGVGDISSGRLGVSVMVSVTVKDDGVVINNGVGVGGISSASGSIVGKGKI